ncbi:hypothetical protein NQ318_005163 [Aromia moschata]|uniref:Nuclear pore complex protein Nup133 n=1 Tax=Aromia moschata TaxID=1265417 RepID=A0AAV8XJ86_9CUCU|nr:hypothetical protein NQ318_005163 [Aromia moschata]
MEKSFQGSFSVKSPFSPRSRQNIGSKRVMPSSFRKSSRLSVSAKSAQSVQVVLRSSQNYVERFGQPLPVLITEALTFADRNTVVSARISEYGYAWVVCGRRLLIWQYRQTPSAPGTPQRKHGGINQCYELQLPQSDLAHRAELVSVFTGIGSNTPACIAVSPEGVLRYWPAVVHEGVTVEQTVDLQGQECDSLTDVEGLGCILATTTCTVVLVQPQMTGGRHMLQCKPLRAPSGWLGGISKRMSSLIFGPISNEHSSETRLVRVLSVPNNDNTWTVYVLAGHSLQKWHLFATESEQLLSVAELNRLVRDGFHNAVWESCPGDQADIDTWLLDIQSDKEGLIALAAAVNVQLSPQVHYAMVSFSSGAATQIRDFLPLKMSGLYREDNPGESLSYRFLLCCTSAYVYNSKSITVLNGLVTVCSNEQLLGDYMNVSVTGPNTPVEMSMSDSTAVNNLSVYVMDPEEVVSAYKDTVGQLKAAFIFHIRNQQSACQDIINELFPLESSTVPGVDNTLDRVVVRMCRDLLDDVPAGDPRWNKDSPLGIGSSYSMQVLHQLEDKQKAFSLYLRFLRESGLWGRLSASNVRDTPMATVHVLGELSEKITAAIVLKSLPNSLLLENAIEKAIEGSDTRPGNGLTNQDIFYREVSKVHRGIQELVNCCEDAAHSDLSPGQVAQVVHDTNEIVLTALNEVIQYRIQNAENFGASEATKQLNVGYLPWTSANGDEGLADALILQHNLSFSYGLKLVDQGQLRNSLLDHFVGLTDLILDGRKAHLESIKNTNRERISYKQYCSDRHKLIEPLLQHSEWEGAVDQLAEKYLDFETLVVICEVTDNEQRLEEYMDRFHGDGFSQYVFNWYLKENKQGKLLERYKRSGKTRNLQQLTHFLSDHPSLAWIQQIFDDKYVAAAETLRKLACEESESLTRQKTTLSLSKLARLAGPNSPDMDLHVKTVNSRLELVAYQEDLPDYVLQQFGYDTLKPRVIPPKDLVCLYVCKEYADAGELEFKKALDILAFVDDAELREELHLKVWRGAILRDSWHFANLDSPLEALQGTLFFKLVDLAIALGADPHELLPHLDLLMEDESMRELQEDKNFQFLIKAGYEHVFRSQMLE